MDEEMMSESFSWDDAYFELELGPHSHSHSHPHPHDDVQFETFRVSISALVPFPGFHPTAYATISSPNHHHEATPILDLDIPTTPTPIVPHKTATCTRERVVGAAGKMMMKLVVKVRSIISIRGVGGGMNRLFANVVSNSNNSRDKAEVEDGQGQGRGQMIKFQKRNKLFGIINGVGIGNGWRRRSKYTTTSSQWPTTQPSSNSILISSPPPPQPQPHHTSSLLHAAIAHCNQTNHFSFQL